MTPTPVIKHQRILLRLSYLLQSHLEQHPIGEALLTRSRDLRLTKPVYERTGVSEYWTIDPEREVVDVFRATVAGTFSDAIRFDRTASLTTPL